MHVSVCIISKIAFEKKQLFMHILTNIFATFNHIVSIDVRI